MLSVAVRRFLVQLKQHDAAGYAGLDEPSGGMLTQGMILHESYKDPEGKYLYPEEVEKRGSRKIA